MKKNRYILAVCLLVAVILVIQNYFLEPKSEAIRESIQTKQPILQKYEYLLANADKTMADIESALNDMKRLEEGLIQEKSEFLATARLQEIVSGYAKKAGLTILRTRPLKTESVEHYSNMPIYYEGNGNIKQVADFLELVESSKTMLKIDQLSLNITNVQNPKDLKFKVQISGLMKK